MYNFGIGMNTSEYLEFEVTGLAFLETLYISYLLWAR